MREKNAKIAKQEHAFKGYTSTYYAQTSNSFNPELPLKGTDSATKSKLIELLTQLRHFKFVAILILVVKKIVWKQNITILQIL